MTKPIFLTLREARTSLHNGEISVSDLVDACLEQISLTEPRLNACITVLKDQSRAQAAEMDKIPLEKRPTPEQAPLWGIPVMVKDAFCIQDVRTTCGSCMLENFVPPYDATVVTKLNEAGAIILAKNNMDEFAMGVSNETSFFGPVSNPWQLDRVPGGSSGGSATAVAAGQAFASIGTDSGGSVRQPAALCGCVGFKPSYGRISRYGTVAHASSFDQAGTFTRCVSDAADMYTAIAGHDPKDTMTVDMPYAVNADHLEQSLKGVCLGVPKEIWGMHLEEDVKEQFALALQQAEQLGAKVETFSMPILPHTVPAYMALAAAEASTNLARFDGVRYGLRCGDDQDLLSMYIQSRTAGFGTEAKKRITFGTLILSEKYYERHYVQAAKFRTVVRRECQELFKQFHAVVMPTSPCVAWRQNEPDEDPLNFMKKDCFTQIANLGGMPALSLPIGLGPKSLLPVGLQLMGNLWDEARLFSIAKQFEAAFPYLGIPQGINS